MTHCHTGVARRTASISRGWDCSVWCTHLMVALPISRFTSTLSTPASSYAGGTTTLSGLRTKAARLRWRQRSSSALTIIRHDGPNQIGLRYNALPAHQMALITSSAFSTRPTQDEQVIPPTVSTASAPPNAAAAAAAFIRGEVAGEVAAAFLDCRRGDGELTPARPATAAAFRSLDAAAAVMEAAGLPAAVTAAARVAAVAVPRAVAVPEARSTVAACTAYGASAARNSQRLMHGAKGGLMRAAVKTRSRTSRDTRDDPHCGKDVIDTLATHHPAH